MCENIKSALNILNDDDVAKIHRTSLQILEELGIKVDDPEIREMLQDAGCAVEGNRVKFPKSFVDKTIANVKKEVTLTSWKGQSLELKVGKTVSHTTGGIPFIIDYQTGEQRNPLERDFIDAARVMNQMDNLDMPCALVYMDDVPSTVNQIKQTELLFRYSDKPIWGPGISTPDDAEYVVRLFEAFARAAEVPSENPIGLLGVSPESPLYYPKQITDTMKIIISAGIPTVALIAPIIGMTAPMTIAGGLAQMNANMLAFACIGYLINPETPILYGSRLSYANMKTGNSIWGLPEVGVGSACAAKMAGYYGFMADVYGLACSSCTFDTQAGYEKSMNALVPMMAGATLISGVGSLASVNLASLEQLVIDNEIFAALKKSCSGIEVNEETLAFDTISKVVNGEEYLMQMHTVKHLRKGEVFVPKLGFDNVLTTWEAQGKKDIRTKANEVVKQILEQENTTVSPVNEEEIQAILTEAYEKLIVSR